MKNILDKTQFKLFLKFTKHLLSYWKKEGVIVGLSGIGVLLGLVNPYLTKLVIDRAFGNKNLRVFIILALIGGVIFVLSGLVSGLKNYLDRQIKIKVNFDLNKRVFKHLEKLDLNYFQNKSTGEHLYRSSYDIDRVADFITTTPPQVIATFPKLLFILIIVLRLNWQMAVFSLCLAPLLYLPPYYFTKRMRRVWEDLIRNSEDIFKRLNEVFSHIQLVKAFAKEGAETRDYLRRKIANIRMSLKNTRLEVISGFAGSAVNKVVIGLISFYGGYQVIKGQMTLGSLTAIMLYIGQLIGLQSSFAGFFQNIALGLVSCRRVEQILAQRPKIVEKKNARSAIFKKGGIVFRDVSFGYKQGEPVLSAIDFNIDGGSHIALAGPSGCGKTTILNLLLRLYDPWSGDIIIDGCNIKEIKFSSLRGQIGIALQEPFLWNDTIENNIRYGKADAGIEEITEIAKICTIDKFVNDLPNRYNTLIGENACKISEGQKQKITIARALLRKPKILILDEAMSSMDSSSEEEILVNTKLYNKRMTLIVVSHRLSTVMCAESVYFFANRGEIIIDNALNLVNNNKEFFHLFSGQAKQKAG
ncbi:MAG: ABC transporter ATP-binding protein [Candidatus Omnitrophica bacterium]|nr:ABC transporter ATP-binding protein [Candidatus Omnitrophota bacterium]